jgi:GT2 family glycosyltransferase
VIYIVIPVHDRRQLTRACLLALREQTEKGFRVVVVDDGSTDGTGEMLREDFPEVVTLRGDGGLWWTGATNRGCAWALARAEAEDAVITLNDDTLPAPEWLACLREAAAAAPHAVMGSLLVDTRTGLVSEVVTRIDWWTAKYSHPWAGLQPDEVRAQGGDTLPSDALCGCGTYLPVRALRELGPFRPELPQYAADFEYSIRAARTGWDVRVSTAAVLASHAELTGIHGSTGESWKGLLRSFRSVRSANAVRYRVRFARLACPRPALPAYLVCDLLRVLIGSLRRFRVQRAA